MTTGAQIFGAQCAAYHRSSGTGVAGLSPALAKVPDSRSDDPTNLLQAVLQGTKSVATDASLTGAAMRAFSWKLSDQQIANGGNLYPERVVTRPRLIPSRGRECPARSRTNGGMSLNFV
jgi:mono/diheme cytochrome c family protein